MLVFPDLSDNKKATHQLGSALDQCADFGGPGEGWGRREFAHCMASKNSARWRIVPTSPRLQ